MGTGMIVGELAGVLSLDDDPFVKGLDRAMTRGEKTTADRMQRTGDSMTKGLTLPLLAVGVAAGKLSLDFDTAFSRMVGLAGVSADEVDGLKESVLGLAGETGQAPQELADALYFVRSAGLSGKDAMDALEMSAKAAAGGLGSTVAVADAVTSAMNGYGPAVLSAAEATDVLVATAREGKAEAAELAPQFGRLIPIAAELGISFDQVGAGLAFLSRSSGDAALSATQLDGVMQKLIKPSEQGAEALAAVGMSTDSIRASIAEKGLMPTLLLLRDRLGDSGFNKFFDDVQGMQGALALTKDEGAAAIPVFDALANSAGATDSAFSAWADTAGFKNKKAFADLQVALIGLGDIIVPIGASVAKFASTVFEWFSKLPEPVQNLVVLLGAVLAATGPLLTVAARLSTVLGALGISTVGLSAALGVIAWPLAIAGAAAFAHSLSGVKVDVDRMAAGLANMTDAERHQMEVFILAAAQVGDLDEVVRKLADGNVAAAERFLEVAEAAGIHGEQLDSLRKIIEDKQAADVQAAIDQKTNTAAIEEGTNAVDEETAAINEVVAALQGYADQLNAMFDPLFGVQTAHENLRDAQQAVTDAVAANSDANADNNVTQEEMIRLNAAAVQAAVDYEGSLLTLKSAIEAGTVSVGDATATLQSWVDQGLITQQQADEAAWSFGVLGGKADDLDGKNVTITAHANVDAAIAQILRLDEVARAANQNVLIFGGGSINARDHAIGGYTGGLVGSMTGRPGPTDTVARMLDPKEYIVDAATVRRLGVPNLEALLAGGDTRPMVGVAALSGVGARGEGSVTTIDIGGVTIDARGATAEAVPLIRAAGGQLLRDLEARLRLLV